MMKKTTDRIAQPAANREKRQARTNQAVRSRQAEKFVPPVVPGGQESVQKEPAATPPVRRPVRRKRKKIKKRNYKFIPVVIVGLLLFIWLFLRLGPVSFGTVIVDGNEHLSQEDVLRVAGAGDRVNVMQLAPDMMRDKLSHDLRIEDVQVARELPATIRVHVTERKPEAVITTMYGFALVDPKGVVIEVAPQIKGVSVPLLTGKKMDTLLLGDTISDSTVRIALTYLQNLSAEGFHDIAEVNVGNPGEIIAYTGEAVSIRLGSGDAIEQRARITEELLKEIRDNHLSVQYIDTDVRSPFVKSK